MNNLLINKLLSKLTLKELYDEINYSDQIIYTLALSVFSSKKDIACKMFRSFMDQVIKGGDSEMAKFLKEKIINLDGNQEFSINDISKKKVAKKETVSYDPDPCSRGSSYSNNRC